MGMDDNINYSIINNNGQVIIATDDATVSAENNISLDYSKLQEIIDNIKNEAINSKAKEKDIETINESLEAIKEELKNKKPKKGVLNAILNGLRAFKFTTEFGVAVASLCQILQTSGII